MLVDEFYEDMCGQTIAIVAGSPDVERKTIRSSSAKLLSSVNGCAISQFRRRAHNWSNGTQDAFMDDEASAGSMLLRKRSTARGREHPGSAVTGLKAMDSEF